MGAVELTRTLAHPQEVSRNVVNALGTRINPRQRQFVVQQQGFVAGVELDATEGFAINPTCAHERQRFFNVLGDLFVALTSGALAHEVLIPFVHLTQVRVAALSKRTHEVQGC